MKRTEKPTILANTNLKWLGKNMYKMPKEISFPEGLFQLNTQMESLGYKLNNHIHDWNNIITFVFDPYDPEKFPKTKHYCSIFVDMGINASFPLLKLFQYIEEHHLYNGYIGTKEWQRDICQKYKIPLIGKLQYLDPPRGQYWFCNELCNAKE
jgi:hypothetical protein